MNGQEAKAFLDMLRLRKAQISRELTEVETLEAGVVRFLGSLSTDAAAMPTDQRKPVITAAPASAIPRLPIPESDKESPPQPKWRDIISEVLRDHGPSLTVVQIRETVRDLGYGDGASDPSLYNSIYTALTRNADLFEKRNKSWWLFGARLAHDTTSS
jgi:hypothetical protein